MKKVELKKIKTEIIIGLFITIVGGVIVAYFQFFLDSSKDALPRIIEKPNALPFDLKDLYTLDKYDIEYINDGDSTTYAWNDGIKTAGFYLTCYFNTFSGIKNRTDAKKGEEYFCNKYDMKSIATISGLSIHNPNIEQHDEIKPNYYNGTIKNGFAYYNPEIVLWATKYLIPDPTENNSQGILFQKMYDELYKKNIRILTTAYFYFRDEQSYISAQNHYLLEMEKEDFEGPTYLHYIYSRTKDTCFWCDDRPRYIGFWIRRGIDGTSDEIWQGLSKILTMYDKQWFTSIRVADRTIFENPQ